MKSTGIVRKVDSLGRVVVPIDLRREMSLNIKDDVEMFVDGEMVIFKKYEPNLTCMVTGKVSKDNMVLDGGKVILSQEGVEILMQEINDSLGN